jgi:hypothetical protein
VKVVFKPVLVSPDSVTELMMAANNTPNCIGLITWCHTFSPSKMWINGLKILNKPAVHLHTQYNRDIPWASIDMDFMNLNQAAHGDREHGFIWTRLRKDRKVVVGHWKEEKVQEKIGTFARAAMAWADWQGAKFVRFGDNMREVAVTDGDKVSAQYKFGFSVNYYAVGDLVKRIDAVTEQQVNDLIAEYMDAYVTTADVRKGGSRLRVGARGGEDRSRHTRLPERGWGQRLHQHLRRPLRHEAVARYRFAAADGRRLRLRCRGRLEDRRAGARRESDGDRPQGRHLVHGGLHLQSRPGEHAQSGCPYARDLPLDRRRQAEAGSASPRDWRQGRPGAAGIRCGRRSGDSGLADRYGQPLPPDRR